VLAFWITRRIAISLQRADNDRLLHGLESGIIVRLPHGEYIEKHTPISKYEAYALTARDRTLPLEIGPETDENGVAAPRRGLTKIRAALSRFYFADSVQKPTSEEIEEAHAHGDHEDHAHAEELDDAARDQITKH